MSLDRRPVSTDLLLRIGLTGSIGMGKSTAAKHLIKNNVPVLDSDAIVHDLYAGDAVEPVNALFPGVAVDGKIDRQKLAPFVLNDDSAMKKLEALIHPMVRAKQRAFFDEAVKNGAKMACIDIPLLFETKAETRFDAVLVVSSSFKNQMQRVLQRPDMTEAKFRSINARQMPDEDKRSFADFVINTDGSKEATYATIDGILARLHRRVEKREQGLAQ